MSNLEGINFYGDSTLDDVLVTNLYNFLNYGFLEIGGFYNIDKDQVGIKGNNICQLRPVILPNTTNYTVFRDMSSSLIWEQNIGLKYSSGNQPIEISGVYIDDDFYPTGTMIGGSGWYIDYSRSQIIFESPIDPSQKVQLPRSMRVVHIYSADTAEVRNLISNWREFNNSSGLLNFSYKAYLPCISIEVLNYKTVRGMELGSRAKNMNAEFEFNIFSANAYEQKKIADILNNLEEKEIILYDIDAAPKALNSYGQLINPTGCTWPDLITNYGYGHIRFNQDFRCTKIRNSDIPLYLTRCRISANFDIYPI